MRASSKISNLRRDMINEFGASQEDGFGMSKELQSQFIDIAEEVRKLEAENKAKEIEINDKQQIIDAYKTKVDEFENQIDNLQSEKIKALSQAEQADELKNLRTIIGTYYPHIIDGINKHISNLKN